LASPTLSSTTRAKKCCHQWLPPVPAGYYTLANASVSFAAVPINVPRHPIPTLLIARLATD